MARRQAGTRRFGDSQSQSSKSPNPIQRGHGETKLKILMALGRVLADALKVWLKQLRGTRAGGSGEQDARVEARVRQNAGGLVKSDELTNRNGLCKVPPTRAACTVEG